jgi:hypothetical protein
MEAKSNATPRFAFAVAWIDDERSQHAHQALGFEAFDRCVHFRKTL